MSGGASIFDLIRESANLAADDALLAVMQRGEPAAADQATRTLLDREKSGGLNAAVQMFDKLSPAVQQIITENVECMFPAVRQCIGSEEQQVCTNAITIITAGGNPRLGYLLSPCLTHSSKAVRESAGSGLVQLAQRHLQRQTQVKEALQTEEAPPPAEHYATIAKLNEDLRYLTSALEQALESYEVHYRSEVLEASLWLADALSRGVWTRAAGPRSRLGRGITEQLLSHFEPTFAGAVCRALTHSELRAPLVRMISLCRQTEFIVALARRSWMLGIPKVRKGFGFVRSLAWLRDGAEPLLDLDPDKAVRVIRLVMATNLNPDNKVEFLREVLLAGKGSVRRAAAWALVEIESDTATETLRTMLSWEDEELSPIALTELMRRRPDDLANLLVRQLSSRSTSVREVAEGEVASIGFQRYWAKFGELPIDTRAEAARAMAKVVPDLPRRLRAKLVSAAIGDRLQAILIVRMLDLCEEMAEYLYRLSHDPDESVRSAAVAALGQLPNTTSERIARQAIHDPDGRVQANAVAALDEMGSVDCEEAVKDKLESENNRVRANAVKALLKLHVREAAETLVAMLANDSHLQRISALWVIERLGLATMIDRVVQLSQGDPHPSVRKRAARIRSQLESHRALAECKE